MNLDKDIHECNKIIAEFMSHEFRGRYGHVLEEGYRIYSNWESLMEIVEKIEGLDGEQYEADIYGNCCHISNVHDNSYGPNISVLGGGKREAVYEACYKFIVEYTNEQ